MTGGLLILALLPLSLGLSGVDVSSAVDAFTCLRSSGYDFAITRGYQSFGQVDPTAKQNIANAKGAGIQYVDVYLFPCYPCGDPATQANQLWAALGGTFGTVWLDIETYQWSSNLAANQAFITTLANTLAGHGAKIGIYSSYYNWEAIVGLSWTGMSKYPLWYAHYDDNPSFSDFVAFGGWTKPNIKQYNGSSTVCGVGVDLDWYP